METNFSKLYKLTNYFCDEEFIKSGFEEYEQREVAEYLENENAGYHYRINPENKYVFYGDVDQKKDGTYTSWKNFRNAFITFFKDECKIDINKDDIMYTKNNGKDGSYHYSIPKINCKAKKMHEIITLFKKKNVELSPFIDTTIYCDHWWRLPNQTVEKKKTKHDIFKGEMIDFVIDYINENSRNIDDIKFIVEKPKKEIKQIKEIRQTEQQVKIVGKSEKEIIKLLFDECYEQKRFDEYEYWCNIMMGLKNTFGDDGYDLFVYASKKSDKFDEEKNKIKWDGIKNNKEKQITIATLYMYAKEDNRNNFIEILNEHKLLRQIDLTHNGVSKYLKQIYPDKFIWTNKTLRCFDGKIWQRNDLVMMKIIGNELYDFLYDIQIERARGADDKKRKELLNGLCKLKTYDFKKKVVATTEEDFTNDDIEFDSKWWLLGFNNKVYDLKKCEFRDYRYDDYISITTGYDWEEPTNEEIKTVNDILKKIITKKDERNLVKQIFSTSLEGRALINFVIFNGRGGNGKTMLDNLALSALGNYGITANGSLLHEKTKTGANPEKANLDKKRLVIFREPPEKTPFENAIIKEMTGGGDYSARTLHEKDTKKTYYGTFICECNRKPNLSEEITDADIRRILDIGFPSKFVKDEEDVNEEKNIYLANSYYEDEEFKKIHKRAFMKILMDNHKLYVENGYKLKIPSSIKERTQLYLEMSCQIIQWFIEEYKLATKEDFKQNPDPFIKLCDAYKKFKKSEMFMYMNKVDKRKYNKRCFIKYFQENVFYNKYYQEKKDFNKTSASNVLNGFVEIKNNDDFEFDD